MSAALVGSFLIASALLIVSPGPGMLFILRQCQDGFNQPFRGLAGMVAADTVLITLSCLGVAALVTRFPLLAGAIKLAGGGYVAWIGFRMFRSQPSLDSTSKWRRTNPFVEGLLITLSNPKAILFFAAFFPLFTVAGAPTGEQFVRLGLLFECANVVLYSLFIVGSRHLLARSQLLRGIAINRLCGGGLLLAAGAATALTVHEFV